MGLSKVLKGFLKGLKGFSKVAKGFSTSSVSSCCDRQRAICQGCAGSKRYVVRARCPEAIAAVRMLVVDVRLCGEESVERILILDDVRGNDGQPPGRHVLLASSRLR